MKVSAMLIVSAVMLCAIAGCATPGTSSKGHEVPIETATLKFVSDVKEGGYQTVATSDLKKWIEEGRNMTIISALTPADDKNMGLIPGAVNAVMPKSEKELTQADTANLLKVAGNDKERPIVVYCGFVACRRSHIGAKILVDNGFRNVYRYAGGTTAWKESGYPLNK